MATFEAEIYEREDQSFGYRIRQNGSVIINQDYLPGAEGYEPMTQEQATARADHEIEMLKQGETDGIRA